jgi:hypothetical protein
MLRVDTIPWHAPDGTRALQGPSHQLDRPHGAVVLPPLHPHSRDPTWPEVVDPGGETRR